MYNTGFGDCFLLRLPAADRHRKILIDCGKHVHSRCKPPLATIVKQVQQDLAEGEEDGKPRIDVLVITHRHQDHVSGFAMEGWEDVEVGEVWMPWTEDPDDRTARRICRTQSMRALQLQQAIPKLGLSASQSDYLLGYAGNNLTNAAAMKLLHNGFRGQPLRRFLPVADAARSLIETPNLPGIDVYILGPSRSEAVIRDMDPPAGEGFLRAAIEAEQEGEPPPSQFAGHWVMDRDDYIAWFRDNGFPDPLEEFSEETARHFHKLIENPETELAAALEKSVNGTSLVLLFRVGRAVLLFPGDAQWGTWHEILKNESWVQLLESVTFYKVGHHGSHNATPREFVEKYLSSATFAMIPTDNVKQWPKIPKQELVARLAELDVQFVRSDLQMANDPDCFKRHVVDETTVYVDLQLPC